MTNEEIIYRASQQLAREGKIKYTGRELKVATVDGGEIVIKETEQIHTFQAWKEIGYSVKKGEHAVARIPVWKFSGKVNEQTGVEESKIFMKTAAFFSESQVEPLKA